MQGRAFLAGIVLCLTAISSGSGPVLADQTDPRLDPLFAELKTADSLDAAQPIEAEIWGIWLRSDNDAVNQLMALGVARLNEGDFNRALAVFDRIVTLAPNFAEGWNKRATTLYLMGRYTESKSDIDRVLGLEPRHFGALSGLGLCNSQLHQPKEALEAFQRALAVNPNLPAVERNIDELKKQLARESI
jgi:tetratricopeptide (TPR) repeat protein